MTADSTQGGTIPPEGRPHQYPCTSCGAALEFVPGTSTLVCPYCGSRTLITLARSQKHDFAAFAGTTRTPLGELPPFSVECANCGSTQTTTALSSRCPTCRGALVVSDDLDGQLKTPDGIVPFVVTKDRAGQMFKAWAGSRWFAPNALKRVVRTDSMVGCYLPHWGFDDKTTTDYTGRRGEHYWETETYTVSVNGQQETRSRQVQRTRWYHAAGRVSRAFVDVLAPAVTSPDVGMLERLGPWDTNAAAAYEPEFLAGFDTPRYTVTADAGFGGARRQMAEQIEEDCRADIGGDEQEVSAMHTTDTDVLFRLLLMPLWMATYVVAGRSYDVYVNANTGEVVGERPYSVLKIALLVVAVVAAVAAALAIIQASRS